MEMEKLVPLSEDLTVDDHKLDIFIGMEEALKNTDDVPFKAEEEFAEGDWAVKSSAGELEEASDAGVYNTYPVWAGNADRYDVHATGKGTIITTGGWVYRTTKFDTSITDYADGEALTVKDGKVPTRAGGSDAVLARVYKAPVDGIMEIQVTRG